jgi:hypothetical protein
VAAVTKLVGSVGAGDLAGLVEGSPLLGYLAGYLASSASPAVVGLSLILTDMLLEKLPALALVSRPGDVRCRAPCVPRGMRDAGRS